MKDLQQLLAQKRQQHLYRQRRVSAGPQAPQMVVDGQNVLSFCSNDYLGLANHPEMLAAFKRGADTYGVGSGAAHLVNGHSAAHHALEEELAAFTGRPRALLFSTGYMANLGTVAALMQRGDTVFEDRLNHASLIDAALGSVAGFKRYAHNDMSALEGQLQQADTGDKLILSDGVFSMDGDLAPLPQLVQLASRHDTWLMVDDAHGFGVLGAQGRGSLEHFGLAASEVPIYMATLGKGLGSFGAFVAGDEALIEYLINEARTYIYTTALPPAVAEAGRAALRLVQSEGWRREHLQQLIRGFRRGAEQLGLPLMESLTAIQPLLVGDAEVAIAASQALLAEGILITAIRPPTVPRGTARLRITLSAAHTETDVERLLSVLASIPELRSVSLQ
ncbi:MAG: 8-amino-7-oxononanoate synthase [Gammaproteobacteria bacterium]|nr:8-amino-7-oxononanoate synthase [Gammaproteobacteria bacterium]